MYQDQHDYLGDVNKNQNPQIPVPESEIITSPKKPEDGFFKELFKFTFLAVAIVLPIRLFIAQPFIVSGASMYPTFDSGDYLIVDELSYPPK
jgi:signal peptidase I